MAYSPSYYNIARLSSKFLYASMRRRQGKCALEVVQLAKRCDILIPMSEVRINPGDQFELALKRFNRKVQQDGILSEARRRAHYESPQARRKRKAAAQRRKQRRTRQPR